MIAKHFKNDRSNINKTILNAVLISFVLISSSCATYVWKASPTHQQVMDGYKTKDQVIRKFGIPTTKKTEGEYEEWYYDFGTKTVTNGEYSQKSGTARNTGSVAGTTYYGNPAIISGSNSRSAVAGKSISVTQDLKTYVKFTLQGDKVILWDTKGLDYGTYLKVKK